MFGRDAAPGCAAAAGPHSQIVRTANARKMVNRADCTTDPPTSSVTAILSALSAAIPGRAISQSPARSNVAPYISASRAASRNSCARSFRPDMLPQDAPDFFDGLGIALRRVAGVHHFLRLDAVDMRALVSHDSVSFAENGASPSTAMIECAVMPGSILRSFKAFSKDGPDSCCRPKSAAE